MPNPEIEYWSSGNIKNITYVVDGSPHRVDGPALTYWYENGQNKREEYSINVK